MTASAKKLEKAFECLIRLDESVHNPSLGIICQLKEIKESIKGLEEHHDKDTEKIETRLTKLETYRTKLITYCSAGSGVICIIGFFINKLF